MINSFKEVKEHILFDTKEKFKTLEYLPFLILSGLIIIISFFILVYFFELNFLESILIAFFLVVLYAILLFFLTESSQNKITIRREIIAKPIIQIKKEPVQVVHEVEKRIYYTNPKKEFLNQGYSKSLENPKLSHLSDYIGSVNSGVYHQNTCRLSKLIKEKYKISKQDPSYFIKNNYRPCEVCIKKTKKI